MSLTFRLNRIKIKIIDIGATCIKASATKAGAFCVQPLNQFTE
jgi:hypothetical protein